MNVTAPTPLPALNPNVDLTQAAARLRETGRTQVIDLLDAGAAERLAHCLETEVPWDLAYRLAGDSQKQRHDAYAAADAAERKALLEQVVRECRNGFSFAYETYMMVPAYMEKRDPGLYLHRLTEYLNSPRFLAFCHGLTGDPRIRRLDAQATCYRHGHFLRRHDDREEQEGRLYAYVLGMTRSWQADWGGLLQFLDEHGDVVETFVPRYNCLSVFAVPAFHCVTQVMPWAEGPRQSVTGWMRT